MKKTKKIALILIAIITTLVLCVNFKVYAGAVPENVDSNGIDTTSVNPEVPDDGISAISDNGEDGTQVPDGTNQGQNIGSEVGMDNYEMHNGDLYVASVERNYEMDQLVDGNVFIVGQNVKITGEINGSLFVFASKLEISEEAYVACHIFAFADTVTMKGKAYDLYSASNKLNMGKETIIYRDMKAAANSIFLSGAVGRDVNLAAEKIQVPDEEEGLTIYGNLNYTAKGEIQNIDKAEITGEVSFKTLEESEKTTNAVLDYVMRACGTIVFDIVMYICLLFFAPKFIERAKEYVSTRGLLAFAIGLAITVIVPIISFLLMISYVGVGLGVLGIFIYGTLLMLNAFVVAATLNEFISSKLSFKDDKFKKGLLLIPVSLVIWALRELPIIGTWLSIIVFLCGVGIIGLYQFDRRKKEIKE